MATRRGFIAAFAGFVTALASRSAVPAQEHEGHEHPEEVAVPAPDSAGAPAEPAQAVAIHLEDAKDLKKVGGSVTLSVKDRGVLLVRDSEDTVRAFHPACTHRQTRLKYDHKNRRLNCPAHGSRFGLDGSVLRGPAKKPLELYHAELSGDHVILGFERPSEPRMEEGTPGPGGEAGKEASESRD
jgi:cytochrome b6-f complex iron-sulfur subunit